MLTQDRRKVVDIPLLHKNCNTFPVQTGDWNPIIADDYRRPAQRERFLQPIARRSITPWAETEFGIEDCVDEIQLGLLEPRVIGIPTESVARRRSYDDVVPSKNVLHLEELRTQGMRIGAGERSQVGWRSNAVTFAA